MVERLVIVVVVVSVIARCAIVTAVIVMAVVVVAAVVMMIGVAHIHRSVVVPIIIIVKMTTAEEQHGGEREEQAEGFFHRSHGRELLPWTVRTSGNSRLPSKKTSSFSNAASFSSPRAKASVPRESRGAQVAGLSDC